MSLITDIHTHVLPGVDDGPQTLLEAEQLLDELKATGTHRVFCTSHYLSPHFETTLPQLRQAYTSLIVHEQARSLSNVNEEGETRLALSFGAEVRVHAALITDIRDGQIGTLGDTQYILLEFNSTEISPSALELVHELRVRRYTPIMAHPERNIAVRKNPAIMEELSACGLLFQVTASCFTEDTGQMALKPISEFAWRLLEQGQIHMIASDTHHTIHRRPGLLDAYDRISLKYGQAVVDGLLENANAVWENEECQEIHVPVVKRKSRFTWKSEHNDL